MPLKAKIFMGEPAKATIQFDAYMKDKVLTKEVIIHTVPYQVDYSSKKRELCIVVIHPNCWDEKKEG